MVDGAGGARLEDRPVPANGPGEIVVVPKVVGLCGTDLEIIDGRIDPGYVRYPLVLGHEWAGVVESGSDRLRAGAPVVVEGIVPCRVCARCVSGDTNLCETYDEMGFMRDGAAGGAVSVRADLVHPLANDVVLEHGALVEPAAVVYRALARSVAGPGLRCLVVGDGTVALLAANLLQLWSPASVTVAGQRPEQRSLVLAAGADSFVVEAPPLGAFDLVVEAAGSPQAVSTALASVERGGTVVLLGLPEHGSQVAVEPADLVNNDVTIVASFGYTSRAWTEVVALLNAKRFVPGFLITHRFPLDRFDEALEVLRHPVPGAARAKVVLELS
ncbi:MAG: 2-desacetyl-2-hydroxyethyl bacteriochlorophyllide dehydrogenase [Acidimicrobiaceae bacterium]|nr:2-desacetyl-2-hydroxyethyl bacteriochlorophyllide dehydrogenase [Acidimicrobiaceae bacterium]